MEQKLIKNIAFGEALELAGLVKSVLRSTAMLQKPAAEPTNAASQLFRQL